MNSLVQSNLLLLGLLVAAAVCSALIAIERYLLGRSISARAVFVRVAIATTLVGLIFLTGLTHPTESTDRTYQRARQYFDAKNRPKSVELAQLVIKREPAHKEAHKLLGACYGIDGNIRASIAAYEAACRIDP